MVKSRQGGRSVGGQEHLWFGACQKCWPQCPSWIRVLTGQSVPQSTWKGQGGIIAPGGVQAGVKFGSQHMVLSQVLLQKHKRVNFWFVAFGFEV